MFNPRALHERCEIHSASLRRAPDQVMNALDMNKISSIVTDGSEAFTIHIVSDNPNPNVAEPHQVRERKRACTPTRMATTYLAFGDRARAFPTRATCSRRPIQPRR